MPITFTDITDAHNALAVAIEEAFDAVQRFGEAEIEKTEKWAELLRDPEFKPGRSNLEQDAKLRAAFPDFMHGYEEVQKTVEATKLEVSLARCKVDEYNDLLKLGAILVVE
jgi:hypothetical protein